MKNLKNMILAFGLVLISSATLLAFQVSVGTAEPGDVGIEPLPQRPISTYCGTHTCDDGTQHPYYKTTCPLGTNQCTRQSCDQALLVILQEFCL